MLIFGLYVLVVSIMSDANSTLTNFEEEYRRDLQELYQLEE